MGLVDGETLAQRVQDRGPLAPADAVRHLREVSWALAYAHARGVIHRDVKPENIMIERGSNRALVTDFGIAHVQRATGLTSDGHVLGTAHYMSPEQVQGATLDGRSDLYALGVVGFYLLSGHLPFEGERAGGVLVAHVSKPAPPLIEKAPNLPRGLAAVIDRCLAKDPADRFATGEDFSEALRRAVEGAVASREPVVVSGSHAVLSEDQASVVWRRAAQLQAEAAARLERETRADATGRFAGDGAPGDGATGAAAAGVSRTQTYRVRDVESAAVEAGISQRFVALALSELPPEGSDATSLAEGRARELLGSALLGPMRTSLSLSRVVRAPARDVLRAIGKSFQGPHHKMILRDQLGPHPLDGGILVFQVPSMDANGSTPFPWLRYGAFAAELRTTLRTLDQDRASCEVTVVADLRPGINMNLIGYGVMTAVVALGSAGAGIAIGVEAMGLSGAALAAPVAVTSLAGAALAVAGARAFYRWGIRLASSELDKLLRTLDVTLKSRSIFDEDANTG
jgi:hypothetical protein